MNNWQKLFATMNEVLGRPLVPARPGIAAYYELDGCTVYARIGRTLNKTLEVNISNVTANAPGTGQFKNMITRLEREAKSRTFGRIVISTIQNKDFAAMLAKHGYVITDDIGGDTEFTLCTATLDLWRSR
jgi:hypothetical protein